MAWYDNLSDAETVSVSADEKTSATPSREDRGISEWGRDIARAIGQGVSFGTGDEIEAFVTMLKSGVPYNKAVKQIRKEIAQFREDEPLVAYPAEIVGSLPTGLAGGVGLARLGLGSVGQATTLGGIYGAASGDDGISSRVTGGVGGAVGGNITSKLAPPITEKARELLGRGLPLTVGQMIGRGVKPFEEALTALPFIGREITEGLTSSLQGFGRATYNEILKPLGKSLPDDISGREAYKAVKDIISKEYEKIVPNLLVPAKADLKTLVAKISADVKAELGESDYGKKAYEVYEDIIKKQVDSRLSSSGLVDGYELQRMLIKVRDEAMEFSTEDPFLRKAAAGLRDVSDTISETVAKFNPSYAPKLKTVNESFSKLIPAERAATSVGAKQGNFTPAQLISSIRATDQSLRKNVFGKGEARLQRFAETADEVMGSTVPKTGTTERLLGAGLVSGVGGLLEGQAGAGLGLFGTAVGSKVAQGLYGPSGRKAAEAFLRANTTIQPKLSRLGAPTVGGQVTGPLAQELLGVRSAQASEMQSDPYSGIPRVTIRPSDRYLLD